MLIFDGADLVGKSTMVQYAVRRLQDVHQAMHMPMHLTRPPESFDYYTGYIAKMSRDAVWDRFHISNLAYRACDEHISSMTPLKYELVDAHLRLFGGFIVLVTADPEIIHKRWGREGELYKLDHVIEVNQRFIEMSNSSSFVMRGDTYHPRIDAVIHVEELEFELPPVLDVIVDTYYDRLLQLEDLLS